MSKKFETEKELRNFEVGLQRQFGILRGCYSIQNNNDYKVIMVPYSNKKIIKKIASTKKKIECIKRENDIYNAIKQNFKKCNKTETYLCDHYYYGDISSDGKYYSYEEYGGYNLIEYLRFKEFDITLKDKWNLLNDIMTMINELKMYGNVSGISDLSLENIVINTRNNKLKLIDLERILINKKYSKYYVCKWEYMPMEMNLGAESNDGHDCDKFDTWCIGIIIFKILFNHFPYYINMKQLNKCGYFESCQHNFNIFEEVDDKSLFEIDIYHLLCDLFVPETERLTFDEFYVKWTKIYTKYKNNNTINIKSDKYRFLDYYSIDMYPTIDISEAEDDSDDNNESSNNDDNFVESKTDESTSDTDATFVDKKHTFTSSLSSISNVSQLTSDDNNDNKTTGNGFFDVKSTETVKNEPDLCQLTVSNDKTTN